MLDLSSWTVEVGALTSLYTVGLLPLTGPTSSWVGFCTQPTAVCAAILISPGPGADILRGVPKSFHSRTRVSAFAGDRKSVVEGKSGSGRVDLGGRRIIKKKNTK